MMSKGAKCLFLFLTLSLMVSCSSVGDNALRFIGDTNQVRGSSQNPVDGLKISPSECSRIVEIYRRQKFHTIKISVDHFYTDGRFYYVVDGFTGSKAKKAFKYGLKINGLTGEIYDRETGTWLSNPLKGH